MPIKKNFITACPPCFKGILYRYRNLESAELPIYSVKGHKEIINCIDGVGGAGIGEGAPEIVTGSRDGMSVSLKVDDVNL